MAKTAKKSSTTLRSGEPTSLRSTTTEQQSTDLARLNEIEAVAGDCSQATLEAKGKFERAFALSRGLRQLRTMITDDMMNEHILPLMGTPLGFKTDRDTDKTRAKAGGPYPLSVVKECLIEAVIRGVYPTGNEFNIIASRAYITKEGLSRLVREYDGVTDLVLTLGVPKTYASGAVIQTRAKWNRHGVPFEITADLPVKTDSYTSVDAILGKATRKLLKRVYDQLTGSELSIPDGEVDDGNEDLQQRQQGRKRKFGWKEPAELEAPAPEPDLKPEAVKEAEQVTPAPEPEPPKTQTPEEMRAEMDARWDQPSKPSSADDVTQVSEPEAEPSAAPPLPEQLSIQWRELCEAAGYHPDAARLRWPRLVRLAAGKGILNCNEQDWAAVSEYLAKLKDADFANIVGDVEQQG